MVVQVFSFLFGSIVLPSYPVSGNTGRGCLVSFLNFQWYRSHSACLKERQVGFFVRPAGISSKPENEKQMGQFTICLPEWDNVRDLSKRFNYFLYLILFTILLESESGKINYLRIWFWHWCLLSWLQFIVSAEQMADLPHITILWLCDFWLSKIEKLSLLQPPLFSLMKDHADFFLN